MKLASLALALGLISPAAFAAPTLSVDFEKVWDFGTEVANTYAAQGVSFTNVLGLSNGDGLGSLPNGDYYAGAPSPLGVAYVQLDGVTNTAAYMNIADGLTDGLSFFYASVDTLTILAYSGLNGAGDLLGSITLEATGDFSTWSRAVLNFNGTAQSFDLSGANGVAALDNIASIPEPSSVALLLAAGGALALTRRRRD